MNHFNLICIILSFMMLSSYPTQATNVTEGPRATAVSNVSIPYIVAQRYFQSNRIKRLPSSKFTTQKSFDKCFGAAPVMGKDGEPTSIDFSKEYVIAVSKPETYFTTELSDVSLKRDLKHRIVFTYKTKIGEKQSYTIVPCLLIVVNKKYNGKVVLKEVR